MTYNAQEISVEAGEPIELYKFDFGSGAEVIRRTNNDVDVVHNTLTYTSSVISRGELTEERNKKGDKLEITMPGTDPIVQKYVGKPPGVRAEVDLLQLHRTDGANELITQFRGRIQTVDFTKNVHEATLQVIALTGALKRNLPRYTYQGLCNHFLYDGRCKVLENDPAFQKFLNVLAVDTAERVITFQNAGSFGADFFEGGFVKFGTDFRAIIRQSGDDLTLMLPFTTSILNQTGIQVNAGCKGRLVEDCTNKFADQLNFGGHGVFVATKNLFATGMD